MVGIREQAGVGHRVNGGVALVHHHVHDMHPEFQPGCVDLVADLLESRIAAREVLRVHAIDGAVRGVPDAVKDDNVAESPGFGIFNHPVRRGLGNVHEHVGLLLLDRFACPDAPEGRMRKSVLDLHLFDDVRK